MSEIRKRIKAPAPDGWQVLAKAIDGMREQIRESFGPRVELREVAEAPWPLDQLHPNAFETRGERLKREIRDRVLDLCGFQNGGEVTADGSASNDLAHERADAIMKIIEAVKGSGWPEGYVPLADDAKPAERLQAIRTHLIHLCKDRPGEPGEFKRASERADVVLAVASLARTHPDPKRLLPRGDRLGDWLPSGTRVAVHLGDTVHSAVVEPQRDMVTVRLDSINVVTEYPRELISKEGEPWTPPKPTVS